MLKLLVKSPSPKEARKLYRNLQALRPRARVTLLAQSLLAVKEGRLDSLIAKAKAASREKARTILKAPRCNPSRPEFKQLLNRYHQWNGEESGRYDRVSLNAKAGALALTINAMTIPQYIPALRRYFRRFRLSSSSREIVLALLRFGDFSDVKLILNRISKEKSPIDYWNHTEIGRTARKSMEQGTEGIPLFLKELLSKREFREHLDPEKKEGLNPQELLSLSEIGNRPLYIRIVAYSAIGAATNADWEHLVELTKHQYGLIARAAGVKLAKLFGLDSLRMLSDKIDNVVEQGNPSSFSEAIRHAEMELYDVASLW